jgi:hypothetical protein
LFDNWDCLWIYAKNEDNLKAYVEKASEKFYSPWIVSNTPDENGQFSAFCYKPSEYDMVWTAEYGYVDGDSRKHFLVEFPEETQKISNEPTSRRVR